MKQILENVKALAEIAQGKGFKETAQQLTALQSQLSLIQGHISPVMLDVLRKVVHGFHKRLTDTTPSTDEVFAAQCQQLAQALFQTVTLTQEATNKAKKIQQQNERATTNQKYFDSKKNEALGRMEAEFKQLQTQNALSLEELLAFNHRLREILEKDFAVRDLHLPKQPVAQPQQETKSASPVNLQGMMSAFSGLVQASSSDDKDRMKNAASSFVGFLLSMVIESLASVCKKIAPSIAPFIGQMTQFAKGALGQMFNMGIEKVTAAQTITPTSSTKTPSVKPATTIPKVTASAKSKPPTVPSSGVGGTLMNAFNQFIGKNKRAATSYAKAPQAKPQQPASQFSRPGV